MKLPRSLLVSLSNTADEVGVDIPDGGRVGVGVGVDVDDGVAGLTDMMVTQSLLFVAPTSS